MPMREEYGTKGKGGDVEFPTKPWSMVTMSFFTGRKTLRANFLQDAIMEISGEYTR